MIVHRNWLYAVSGTLWWIAGGILILRGYVWVENMSAAALSIHEILSIAVAVLGYWFGFSKITRRNIDRITNLPERSSIFAFTALRGYILIVVMISAGILLRDSAIPKDYLSVPYTAMGGALLLGGVNFWGVFVRKTRTPPRRRGGIDEKD